MCRPRFHHAIYRYVMYNVYALLVWHILWAMCMGTSRYMYYVYASVLSPNYIFLFFLVSYFRWIPSDRLIDFRWWYFFRALFSTTKTYFEIWFAIRSHWWRRNNRIQQQNINWVDVVVVVVAGELKLSVTKKFRVIHFVCSADSQHTFSFCRGSVRIFSFHDFMWCTFDQFCS